MKPEAIKPEAAADGDAVHIYTDGSCLGNPGVGGWGAVMIHRGRCKELSGAEAETTNNRMEVMAAIASLDALKRPCRVILCTDSEYLRRGMDEWLPRWRRRGWRKADGRPVKNDDLWRRLLDSAARHEVTWEWVRGHSGHPENERADRLARKAADEKAAAGGSGRE